MFGFLGFVAIFGSGPSFTTRRAWSTAQLSIGFLIVVLEIEFEV